MRVKTCDSMVVATLRYYMYMRKFGKIVHCAVAAALLMEMIISFRFGSLLYQGKKPHHIIGLYVGLEAL